MASAPFSEEDYCKALDIEETQGEADTLHLKELPSDQVWTLMEFGEGGQEKVQKQLLHQKLANFNAFGAWSR